MTHPYGQNIVACIWDFDKTLIPGYMQTPLFEHYGVNETRFWRKLMVYQISICNEAAKYPGIQFI